MEELSREEIKVLKECCEYKLRKLAEVLENVFFSFKHIFEEIKNVVQLAWATFLELKHVEDKPISYSPVLNIKPKKSIVPNRQINCYYHRGNR